MATKGQKSKHQKLIEVLSRAFYWVQRQSWYNLNTKDYEQIREGHKRDEEVSNVASKIEDSLLGFYAQI